MATQRTYWCTLATTTCVIYTTFISTMAALFLSHNSPSFLPSSMLIFIAHHFLIFTLFCLSFMFILCMYIILTSFFFPFTPIRVSTWLQMPITPFDDISSCLLFLSCNVSGKAVSSKTDQLTLAQTTQLRVSHFNGTSLKCTEFSCKWEKQAKMCPSSNHHQCTCLRSATWLLPTWLFH